MRYTPLNQSQIRVISTIDTTINVSNDLTELDWGKFDGPAAIVVDGSATPTASTEYMSTGSTLAPSNTGTNRSDETTALFGCMSFTSDSTNNYISVALLGKPQVPILIDNVLYYGYKTTRYSGAFIFGAGRTTKQYVMPKGVLKIIMYDANVGTMITKEVAFAGKAKTNQSSTPDAAYYSTAVAIQKADADIILGIFFEAEPITVTKNLTGCTATDNTTNNQYNFGQPYTIEVKPTTGHTLTGSTISFTADGVTIPTEAYAWDEIDGICTINPIYVSNQLVVNVTCKE